ncbi:hypothetical protein BGZ63DRAFT_85041 [Mariannaea sp. PMI_226]|nr:hypothetical protein BGZ63DRAFT_85041 [Mariannaea sp. PMI_226]
MAPSSRSHPKEERRLTPISRLTKWMDARTQRLGTNCRKEQQITKKSNRTLKALRTPVKQSISIKSTPLDRISMPTHFVDATGPAGPISQFPKLSVQPMTGRCSIKSTKTTQQYEALNSHPINSRHRSSLSRLSLLHPLQHYSMGELGRRDILHSIEGSQNEQAIGRKPTVASAVYGHGFGSDLKSESATIYRPDASETSMILSTLSDDNSGIHQELMLGALSADNETTDVSNVNTSREYPTSVCKRSIPRRNNSLSRRLATSEEKRRRLNKVLDRLRSERSDLQQVVNRTRWITEDWLGVKENKSISAQQVIYLVEDMRDRCAWYEAQNPKLRAKYDKHVDPVKRQAQKQVAQNIEKKWLSWEARRQKWLDRMEIKGVPVTKCRSRRYRPRGPKAPLE